MRCKLWLGGSDTRAALPELIGGGEVVSEPCLCGDPECTECYPSYTQREVDYDEERQREIDLENKDESL